MHAERRTRLHRCALFCALLIVVIPTSGVASARSVLLGSSSNAAAANLSSARLAIKKALFSQNAVVVLKGGTLTLTNVDNVAYRIKVGATLVVVPAKGSKTVQLPQRGTFSITCAKAPSLKATLTVK